MSASGFTVGAIGLCLLLAGCSSPSPSEGVADGDTLGSESTDSSGTIADAFKVDVSGDTSGVAAAVTEFERYQDSTAGITPVDAGSDLPDVLPALDDDSMAGGNEFGDQGLDGEAAGRSTWMSSGSEAIRLAQKKNLPLLMWMANSRAPGSNAINDQVFVTPDFEKMANKRFIGLKIDYGDEETRTSKYYINLKDRYKPRGAPVLILVRADGTEYTRYRGYKKNSSVRGWLQRLDADLNDLEKSEKEWMDTLRRSGYRDWKDTRGRTFFGRLVKIDGDDAWFLDRYKRRYEVPMSKLDPADRAAILKAND